MDKELKEAINRLRHEKGFLYIASNYSISKDIKTVLNALEQKNKLLEKTVKIV